MSGVVIRFGYSELHSFIWILEYVFWIPDILAVIDLQSIEFAIWWIFNLEREVFPFKYGIFAQLLKHILSDMIEIKIFPHKILIPFLF